MKKTLFFILISAVLIACGACGEQNEEMPPEPQLQEEDDELVDTRLQVGFSLAGEGPFYDQLALDFEEICDRLDYRANILTAASADQQQRDITSLLALGVELIVIDPVDVDALESVLADSEEQDVPVINIIDMINGTYSTLISPDYIEIGQMAAQRAAALFSEEGGGAALVLKTEYDSFIMQLQTDGFTRVENESDKLKLASEVFCGADEERAYQSTAEQITTQQINFVFAQSVTLARGAMRAIEESGQQVHLVVYGGDMDIIKDVQAGKIDAAIFFGTYQLADAVMGVADEFIKSTTYKPDPFIELTLNMVTSDNASEYVSDNLLYAQITEQQQE